MGQFDAAISYLDDFSAAGNTMPVMKNGALGDAWSEKGELDKALSFYRKAADAAEGNEILQPYYLKKVALLSTQQGKQDDAREAWETIRDEYPTAPEVKDAEKYLAEMR
jgi:tetratricopeptide (TPR) repeat protein